MNRRLLASIVAAGLAMVPHHTNAQASDAYPARPIRVIVPSTPGSPPDLVGRVIVDKLPPVLGQPLLVENRPGATGIIGLDVVAKAAPDGYTLGIIAMPQAVIPSMVSKMPYDTEKDLAAVARVSWSYNVLAVRAGSNLTSVGDLVRAAKQKPGALRFSSGGNGTPSHLAGELLKREAGIDLTHVPYKGGTAAVVAVVGGEVDMAIGPIGPLSPHIKSGKVRALATSAPARIAAHPELPTFAELGYPGVQILDWHGFVAPAGTPRNVLVRLHAGIGKALAMPDVKERLASLGLDTADLGPEQFSAHIHSEVQRWGKLVRDAGIKAD